MDYDAPSIDWFADDPLIAKDDDALDRQPFADAVIRLLEKIGSQERSAVLGLIGPWGSGKSSLLHFISEHLRAVPRDERAWIVAEFNPWFFQDLPSLQTGFFRALSAAVPGGRSWKKFRSGLASLSESVAPLGSLGAIVGLDASTAISGMSRLIRGGDGIEQVKNDVEKELRRADRPILVVVDDVDRLDPGELLLLFKLIRLVGRLPNVFYLLAYDEDTILDALGRTGLIGTDSPRRSIDYLEKIVQIRLDVPPLRAEQVSTWVDREVEALAAKYAIETDDDFDGRFSRAYYGHIRDRLRTPRAIKRYFAQVDSFLAEVQGEVDFVDFLVLNWLRASEPLVYYAITEHRGRLLGDVDFTARGSIGKRDLEEDHRYWRSIFTHAKVEQGRVTGVADLLGQLFPHFAHEWSDSQHKFSPPRANPGRISNADYFDRFFALGVPEEDLSDRLVTAASSQILADIQGNERSAVEAAWPKRADLIINKMQPLWHPGESHTRIALEWLARHFDRLPKRRDIADERMRTQWFGKRLYESLQGDDPAVFIRNAGADPSTLPFCSFLVGGVMHDRDQESAEAPESFQVAEREFAKTITSAFEAQTGKSPLEIPDEVWQRIGLWERIDPAAVRDWVNRCLDGNEWPPLDLVARTVNTSTTIGGNRPVTRIEDLDLGFVDRVVGLDRVYISLANELDAHEARVERGMPATPSNRRAFALAMLKSSRPSRQPSEAATSGDPEPLE